MNPPRDMAPSEKKYLQESIDEYADFREENPLIDAIINDLLVGSTPTLSGELYDEYRHPLNQEKLMFIINGKSSRNKVSLTRELRKFRKDQIQRQRIRRPLLFKRLQGISAKTTSEKSGGHCCSKSCKGISAKTTSEKNQAAIAVQKVARISAKTTSEKESGGHCCSKGCKGISAKTTSEKESGGHYYSKGDERASEENPFSTSTAISNNYPGNIEVIFQERKTSRFVILLNN